jgi:hypothetical protein
VCIEQNAIRHAESEARLALDQRRELRLFIGGQDVSAPRVSNPSENVFAAMPEGKVQLGCSHAKTGGKGGVFGNLEEGGFA